MNDRTENGDREKGRMSGRKDRMQRKKVNEQSPPSKEFLEAEKALEKISSASDEKGFQLRQIKRGKNHQNFGILRGGTARKIKTERRGFSKGRSIISFGMRECNRGRVWWWEKGEDDKSIDGGEG